MIFNAENILLIGSILLFVSIVVSKTGYRFGIPTLLVFLLVGMLFGSDGLGLQFHDAGEAQFIQNSLVLEGRVCEAIAHLLKTSEARSCFLALRKARGPPGTPRPTMALIMTQLTNLVESNNPVRFTWDF